MTTLSELTDSLIGQGIPITGIRSDGSVNVAEGQSITGPQQAIIDSEYAIWNAQTAAQKLQTQEFIDAKAAGQAIRAALNAIDLPSTLPLPYEVLDTDGITVLFTVPDDTEWSAYTNAQVKDYVRNLSKMLAMVLDYAIMQKEGYWTIKKYIRSELNT